MLRNYLLIAFRNLWHNKVYALINILGLAIGLTAALFIFQYVQFERSYDSFHENADNIYRVIQQFTINGNQGGLDHISPSNFGPAVKQQCLEVLDYARLWKNKINDFVISYQAKEGTPPIEFLEPKVYYTEASFLDMFSFPMIMGDSESLREPNSLLLSETMAQKIFGTDWQQADPIGKVLTVNGKEVFMINGVFKEVPENSHIKFEVLLSLPTLAEAMNYDEELYAPFSTYLLIDPRADINILLPKLQKIVYECVEGVFKREGNINTLKVSLQPVRATHLHSFGYTSEPEIRGSATAVQFLLIIAGFILLLAWINYVNLSTARALKRAKEVGIRKVVGAGRRQLMTQFLLEALLINLLGIIVALTLYQLGFPFFTHLVEKEIPITALLETPWLLSGIGLVLLFGTLLSGGYSAFVLSSFKAVSIMKGKFHTTTRGIVLRKSLIVFQFIISVGLIIGTFTVYQQLDFMKKQDLGFDLSQKLIVRAPKITDENHTHHYESFKTALQKVPDINHVTASHLAPSSPEVGVSGCFVIHKKQPDNMPIFSVSGVDYDYLETYNLKLLHGRGFSREFPSDKEAAVITEDVAIALGFDPVESALQETLVINPDWSMKAVNIIGIVKNINLNSLKFESWGVVYILGQDHQEEMQNFFLQFNYYTIELENTLHLKENMAYVEEVYKSHFPGNPFTYFFLDDHFNAQYRAEEQFGKVFTLASGLAIFIACLGLFGLSAFTVRQRTKEIGIRKVLGAPVQSILLLLSSDYIKLIVTAGLIALPVAYWSLHRWLESYVVRIPLSWWLFLMPVGIVIFIALFTVSVQTIKAAMANPANSLRHE
jgi:putative ABC transport system permease protein